MSFLGKIFGSDDALAKVVDTATGLLDEAFYTDQEEAADKAAARTEAQGMVIEWVASTTGSRLARRVIAFMITSTWLGMKVGAAFLSMVAIWAGDDRAYQLTATAAIAAAEASDMTSAMMLILGFYFALPYVGDISQAALQKFSKQ